MKTYNLPLYAQLLWKSVRVIVYSLGVAIADLIDNSILTDAIRIDIIFSPIGDNIYILDYETRTILYKIMNIMQ